MYKYKERERVPRGILCCACELLDGFTGTPSISLEFLLLHESPGLSLKVGAFACSFGGTVFACTIVDLHASIRINKQTSVIW